MSNEIKQLAKGIATAHNAGTVEALAQMAKEPFPDGVPYSVSLQGGVFNVGFIIRYMGMWGTGKAANRPAQRFGIDFLEFGLGAGLSGAAFTGVSKDLKPGVLFFNKTSVEVVAGIGYVELSRTAGGPTWGVLGIKGGGVSVELLANVGVGNLHIP
jgi:hypothetical protein